jgi:hypothetical protein
MRLPAPMAWEGLVDLIKYMAQGCKSPLNAAASAAKGIVLPRTQEKQLS